MLDRRAMLRIGAGSVAWSLSTMCRADSGGGFNPKPIVVALLGGGRIQLQHKLEYTDTSGEKWRVPKNFICDGASIPRLLWSVAGGPMDGDYRDAAIIHDRYCDTMERTWESTHKVFYDAMIASGISSKEATSKYWAVYYFGPRWNETHRWTSFMELNMSARGGWKSMAMATASPPPPPPPPGWDEAILQREIDAYRQASTLIDERQLGPDDVPNLVPPKPIPPS